MKKTLVFAVCSIITMLNIPPAHGQSLDVGRIDFDFPLLDKIRVMEKAKRQSGRIDGGSILFGSIVTNSQAPFDFNPYNSFEIAFVPFHADSHTRTIVASTGLMFDWKNFALTGKEAMSKTLDNEIALGPYPDGSNPRLSKLSVFSLSVPTLLSINVCNGFGFTFGPVFNLNAGSRIKTKYRIEDEKMKDVYKDAHCNLLTVDLMGELNLNAFQIFVKCSPMNLMDNSYWPDFQYLSFGIAL